jgi:diacylglycerol kinase family enzyme
MRLLLVVNVSASAVTPRARVVIAKALAADHKVDVVDTKGRGDATILSAQAATEGYEVVVVLGGDGTVNEAANGLVGTSTALALLPGGSTNVFARTLGSSPDPIEATGQLLAGFEAVMLGEHDGPLAGTGGRRRIGVGCANGRHFLFNLGAGFDAAVINRVERRGQLKRYAGHPLFVATALHTWMRHYDRGNPHFAVTVGDDSLDRAWFAAVLNSDPYTYLGRRPVSLSPGTNPGTGLGVVAFGALNARVLLRSLARAVRGGGGVERHPKVWVRRQVAAASIQHDTPFPYQVDGEYLGETTHVALSHRPDALDLIIPAPLSSPTPIS